MRRDASASGRGRGQRTDGEVAFAVIGADPRTNLHAIGKEGNVNSRLTGCDGAGDGHSRRHDGKRLGRHLVYLGSSQWIWERRGGFEFMRDGGLLSNCSGAAAAGGWSSAASDSSARQQQQKHRRFGPAAENWTAVCGVCHVARVRARVCCVLGCYFLATC